jgi:transcriptional regulator with XRE-family HTH domain
MMDLLALGSAIAQRRKETKITQADLAKRAGISRATLAALEGGRMGELGFNKVMNILTALKFDLQLINAETYRPTLDDLQQANEARLSEQHKRTAWSRIVEQLRTDAPKTDTPKTDGPKNSTATSSAAKRPSPMRTKAAKPKRRPYK